MYMDPSNLQDEINRSEDRPQIGLFRFWEDVRIVIETGDPETIEYVEWTKIGDRNEPRTVEKIVRLKGNPSRGRPPAREWAIVEPHYKAWKTGQERTEDGTAFEDWRGVDPKLARTLEGLHIYTVEAFAAVPSHQVGGIKFPHVSRWHDLAKKFVAEQAGREELQKELSKRDREIEDMKATIAAMQAEQAAKPKTSSRKAKKEAA